MDEASLIWKSDGSVYLRLPGKKYKPVRYLGRIVGDTFYCARNYDNKVFREASAFGFCYILMRDGRFTRVVVRLPVGQQLVTTRKNILQNGEFLYFRKNQLERQLFLPLDKFGDVLPDVEKEDSEGVLPSKSPEEEDLPRDNQLDIFGEEERDEK